MHRKADLKNSKNFGAVRGTQKHLGTCNWTILFGELDCGTIGAARACSVGDNGPGIPAKEISEVFEPFVTTKTEGLGMGLAICKSILAAHGGTISVESSVSRGCRFSFVLPLRQSGAS